MVNNPLKAGFGKGEIRFPQEMFPVEQFIGVHDSPYARVMLLEDRGVKMVIAALELVNVPPKGVALCQDIIERVTQTPKQHIWVHMTHAISTMHEPGPMGPPDRRPPETEEDRFKKKLFFAAIEQATEEAARQAAAHLGEARIGWGTGQCDVNCNRDVQTPFGWWIGLNPDGPSNKTMTVLRVEDINGTPKGFCINYGIKPCAIDNAGMEAGNRLVSADVCGVCSRLLEDRFGIPALFCVSAAGDQVPKEQALLEEVVAEGKAIRRDYGVTKGLEIAERLGTIMGRNAIAIAEKTECTQTDAPILHRTVEFLWPMKKSKRDRAPGAPVGSEPAAGECTVTAEILTLGNAAFVAEKPEVNCQTELELKKRSPFANTCLICMVNGEMKYMPDRLAYERNTFESQSSILQSGAAERFVEEVAAKLNDIFNRA